MKILMISSGFPPKVNTGAEKFCYELSKKLIQMGLEVEVATDTELDEYNGIKLHKLFIVRNKYSRKLFFDYYNLINVIKINKILDKAKPDVVHFHNLYGIGTYLVYYISMNYKTVLTVHDLWPTKYSDKTKFINNIHKYILSKHLNNAILVSPSKYLSDKLKLADYNKIEIIKNGIDLPFSKINITDISPRFLYVGRLIEDKGIKFIADFFSNKLQMDITIVGDGPLLYYVKNKPHMIAEGFIKNMHNYYINHNILIVPSLIEENQPTVILEASSYGLPTIASDIGGIPELIDHGKTGLLFKPGDEADLERQLHYLLKNPQKIQEFGQNAKMKVKMEFNWDKTISSYLALYNRLINI